MARPPTGAGQCRSPERRKSSLSKQCEIQSKKNQVRQPQPAAAKMSKRTSPNQRVTSHPRSGRGARPTLGPRKPSSHHHARSACHVPHSPGRPATRGTQPRHPRHLTCASFSMQCSSFWTGALETLSILTNPRFWETPSGRGGTSHEELEISETKFLGQPTPCPTSAFMAGPL